MDAITHNQITFFVPGDRDPHFGLDGVITLFELKHALDTDRHVKGFTVLADDKILVSAWLARDLKGIYGLARFNPDGSVDTSFADMGLAQGNFANGYDSTGGKLAVRDDGHIIMLGWSREVDVYSPKRLVIARFDINGLVDHSFGEQGCVVIENSALGELVDDSSTLQLLADGALLVSATYLKGDTSTGVVLRVDTHGNLDKSFNKTGQLEIHHHAFTGLSVTAIRVQADNTILVAGSARHSQSETQGYVARYTHTGELDTNFGGTQTPGFSLVNIPNGTVIFHELIDTAAGNVVGIGQASSGQRNWGLLVGFDTTGNPFPEFNQGRPVLTSFNADHGNEWVCATRQADGSIVTAGGSSRLYIARYLANGSVDRSFGQNGCIQEDTQLVTTPALLQTQTTGRILLAGNTLGLGGALGHVYGYQG
ncbi:hypothetical protein [Pseudomonas brassicacearum]|uniref:Delta-60 repeat domain-containing protein n=1 Tax=Pseudomonas brassicacearum TaxID=930166 RepID=A0A423GSG1_9PSED|nr:hypothetical protein [Pseudomonas brassicacearum]ROM98790.1 hypothetical protein BK658_12680 [Pseudomonas brassicacearum]